MKPRKTTTKNESTERLEKIGNIETFRNQGSKHLRSMADGSLTYLRLMDCPRSRPCKKTPMRKCAPGRVHLTAMVREDFVDRVASSRLRFFFSFSLHCHDVMIVFRTDCDPVTLHRYQKAMKILEKYFPLEVRSCEGSCQGFWTRIASFRW